MTTTRPSTSRGTTSSVGQGWGFRPTKRSEGSRSGAFADCIRRTKTRSTLRTSCGQAAARTPRPKRKRSKTRNGSK
nr:MAG TPA: hypothetical protein [Caudoviricetes sp.]